MAMPTNLRSLDLNLLTVFEAVYEAGSITRAADRLALSQPATSHALSRLRDACADDLFVRVGQGIVPTPVAKRVYPEIKKALDGLRRAVGEARGFEPATSSRHFRISIPHPMGPIWALAIRAAARAAAPDVSLEFETRTLPIEVATRLRSGELDVCVDWFPVEGDRFVLRKLFEEHIFFAARPNHPRAKPGMSTDDLRREQFVRTHYRTGPPPDAVRHARRGIEELDLDWALHVSEFLEIPYVVLQTDLLGFMLKSMMNPGLNTANLQLICEIPPAIGIPIYLVWHETRRADDGHRWLRDLVAATVCGAVAE
jgi:LysR family transcriptional activator for leuABCD operon